MARHPSIAYRDHLRGACRIFFAPQDLGFRSAAEVSVASIADLEAAWQLLGELCHGAALPPWQPDGYRPNVAGRKPRRAPC